MLTVAQSDFNTAGFSYKTSQLNTIDFHSDRIVVRYSEYPKVHMRGVLRKIIAQIDLSKLSALPGPEVINAVKENEDKSETITQAWIWPKVGEFLKENDVVITETGTANFGIWETKFPKGVTAISQVLWGSIGYSVGATQGAALAVRDAGTDRRTILFVGDGSLQLTVQEISTMVRLGLKPIMYNLFPTSRLLAFTNKITDLSYVTKGIPLSDSFMEWTPPTTIFRSGDTKISLASLVHRMERRSRTKSRPKRRFTNSSRIQSLMQPVYCNLWSSTYQRRMLLEH